jgi:ferredoxin
MRVIIDRDLCEGQGACEQLAPQVFVLDDAGVLHLRTEQLGDEQLAAVREAVRRCPKQALRLDLP